MIELRAHAKINLHLHSQRRRADGFHELRTVFCHLDLHDTVRLAPLEHRIELISGTGLGVDEDLAGRAALRLRQALGKPELGCRIEVDKHLPIGGGLGGGSADAAAVLRGLAEAWDVDDSLLLSVAARLGADIPFLLRGGLALAHGIGEHLHPLRTDLVELPLLLIFPNCQIETPKAYRWLDQDGLDADVLGAGHLAKLLDALHQGDAEQVMQSVYNGFDQPVRRRVAEVDEAMKAADEAGFYPLLCGSGSTVAAFGAGDEAHPTLSGYRVQRAKLSGLSGPF